MRQAFQDLATRAPDTPLLVLNGMSAENGCRFNGSMLSTNAQDRDAVVSQCRQPLGLEISPEAALPATVDLVDFLCQDERVSLSTAALFSARFPIVLPAGEIQQCVDEAASADPDEPPSDPARTFVVDGGYLEGSGAGTAVDLWSAMEPLVTQYNESHADQPCVVPFFVQIDNGYIEPSSTDSRPPDVIGLQELMNLSKRSGIQAVAAQQAAQLAFGKPFTGGVDAVMGPPDANGNRSAVANRYALFATRAHPGSEPSLGWTLSNASFDDLVEQYRADPAPASEVAGWFHGLTCT
jgi:hypothetical protein